MPTKIPGYDEPYPPAPVTDFGGGCVILIIVFLVVSAVVAAIQVLF